MKKIATILVIALAATLAHAGTAFLSGEQESGLHKICYYDYLGDTVAITIRSTQLCPLTIRTN